MITKKKLKNFGRDFLSFYQFHGLFSVKYSFFQAV